MSLPLNYQEDATGGRTWSLGEISASLLPCPGGWRYVRAPGDPGLLLPPEATLSMDARLGEGSAVARLEAPLLLPPESTRTLWLSWPLVLVVTVGEGGAVLDRRRPGARRTVLGPVDRGEVLPALNTGLLSGPEDPTLPAWTHAALRVVVENRTAEAIQLRRALVNEPALALFQRGENLAAGDLHIRVHDVLMAEAAASAGAAPEEYLQVGTQTVPMAPLSWLRDATHRSVEFAL